MEILHTAVKIIINSRPLAFLLKINLFFCIFIIFTVLITFCFYAAKCILLTIKKRITG